jgi:hypothetical protein
VLGLVGSAAPSAAAYGPDGVAVDQSHVYWANPGGESIGRANLDGTDVDQRFISTDGNPRGVAVDGSHVYWVNNAMGTIGRANLDGTDVDQSLVSGIDDGRGMAVDSTGIYWATNNGTIGHANLDGSAANQNLVADIPPSGGGPEGVALDGADVIWGSYYSQLFDHYGQIGEAAIDGTDVDYSLVASSGYAPEWVAADDEYIYWSNYDDGHIGRSSLGGSGIDWDFIDSSNALGGAVNRTGVYWADASGTIGRANLDGGEVNENLVTGIDPEPPFAAPIVPGPVARPSRCTVAYVKHDTLAGAKAALAAAGCRLGKVYRPRHHSRHRLLVVKQEPLAGTVLAAGSPVSVRVSAAKH